MVNLNYFHLNVIIRTIMNNADKFTNFLGCLGLFSAVCGFVFVELPFYKARLETNINVTLLTAILFILLFEE